MNNRIQFFGKRGLSVLVLFAGIVFLGMIGCDRMTRYRILTFFFEGVPSPDAKRPEVGADANIVIIINPGQQDTMDSNGRIIEPDKLGQKLSSRHDFVKDCAQCHTGGFSSGQQELREPLPDLCYSCHANLHREDDYLHGPLNVGECIFCHDPHQSAYIHLQKVPQPQLCYRCHQRQDIVTIPDHQERLEGLCTDCHDPHGSPLPQLLKPGRENQNDPNSID